MEEAKQLLGQCRHRLRMGDRSAILDLLDLNPTFICVGWVREKLLHRLEGGLPLRKRGRPRGRYKIHPLVVVGLVDHLIATKRAKNPEQAFLMLYGLRVLSYESARECFYRGLRDKRFEPVLMEFPELRQEISAETSARLLNPAEVLQPGSTITRRYEDPQLGAVKIIFKGGEPR